MSLAGKVALITGGTKGIGRATALALAKKGCKVSANYSSDGSYAASLVEELGADNCIAVKGDAGDVASIERMVKETVDRFGSIDILVPCAGILHMKTLTATTEADFDLAFRLNVKGPYFLAQKTLPHMRPGGGIVFVASTQCQNAAVTPNYCLYVSTKGAIEQMTRVIAKEAAAKNVTVNAVSPGPTATELFMKGKSEELVKTIERFSPFERLGKPEEIAEAIVFLAESSWVSGQVVRVNGAVV